MENGEIHRIKAMLTLITLNKIAVSPASNTGLQRPDNKNNTSGCLMVILTGKAYFIRYDTHKTTRFCVQQAMH
jgi:hypothetical protein